MKEEQEMERGKRFQTLGGQRRRRRLALLRLDWEFLSLRGTTDASDEEMNWGGCGMRERDSIYSGASIGPPLKQSER